MKIVSRRDFVKTMCCLGAGAVTWGALPNLARAAGNSGNGTKVLFINLNGGLDGLYALQPNTGDSYTTLNSFRPTLWQDSSTLLNTPQGFGFHPNLTLFKNLYDSGKLTAIMGVGYENMSRSHLDAEVVMARGVPNRLTASKSGFLNRLGAANGWDSLHAVSVTGTDLAFDGGDYRGVQARSLQDFYFHGYGSSSDRNQLVATSFSIAQDAPLDAQKETLSDFAKNFLIAVNSTDSIRSAVQNHSPAVSYANNGFGRALKDIDILFSSPELDTQVGYMRVGGFDTHSDQKAGLDQLLLNLNTALSTFMTSMQSKNLWNNLIIVIASEFGRTNRENGSGGTDHGGANSVFLLGGAVNGGQIYGSVNSSELNENGWLLMQYNIVEIYRRTIERVGLDADAVFSQPTGPSLTGLFT